MKHRTGNKTTKKREVRCQPCDGKGRRWGSSICNVCKGRGKVRQG